MLHLILDVVLHDIDVLLLLQLDDVGLLDLGGGPHGDIQHLLLLLLRGDGLFGKHLVVAAALVGALSWRGGKKIRPREFIMIIIHCLGAHTFV